MNYAYSNQQMRRADAATIAAGTSSMILMERAGQALADAVSVAMHSEGTDEVLFVCGGGNNGGDGFVAARILLERGEEVAVLCLAERFSEDCEAVRAKYGGEVLTELPRRRYRMIVDCLFGAGMTRPAEGCYRKLIEYINNSDAYVIACDLPSGLLEGGIASDPCVEANETVTMGQCKQALLLADGADYAGKISVAQIGISSSETGAEVWENADVQKFFPKRRSNSHKGTYGTATILAGGTYSGAAFLAAGACLKSGVGYTKLCVTEEMFPYAIGRLPAVVLRPFKTIDGDILASGSIAVGMGTGISERLYAYLAELLSVYTGTLILDADALNTIATYGVEVLREKSCRVIVTPHPKEFSRLTGKSVPEILANAVEEARDFARKNQLTVLLKNNRTIITDGVRVAINPTGSPALAKGGSGDVLSGLLAGICARNIEPYDAGCCASFLLGRAGELVAMRMGEYSPDPTDVIRTIAQAICSLS